MNCENKSERPVVYSQNGAYAAHFFEDMAWGKAGKKGFQKQVLNFLKNSNGAPGGTGTPGTLSLAQVNARLTKPAKGSKTPAEVAAYILAPHAELPDKHLDAPGFIDDTPLYQDQLNELIELLPTIIPRLKGHEEPNLYQALESGWNEDGSNINDEHADLLNNHARGRVLMQYDPQNGGYRDIRLFFETKLIFSRRLGSSAQAGTSA